VQQGRIDGLVRILNSQQMVPAALDHTNLMIADESVETMQLKSRGSAHILGRQGLAAAAVE
jgi:hypothetical protein